MKIKEIENALLNYKESNETYNHKENALKEFDKAREVINLDELSHIGFIIANYPDYDHFLLKLTDKNWFIRIGFNKEYLQSASKKEIHAIAKNLAIMFGKFKLAKENKDD